MRSAGMAARLLDAAPVGMLVASLDGGLLYANKAFCTMTGHEPDALDGTGLCALVHADDEVAVRLQLERLTRGETLSCRGEHRFRHVDGSPICVALAAALVDGEGAAPAQVIVQVTNIELQKRAEEALVYSESRWHSALECARQGVWDYDMRRDRMFYSSMWRRMRGLAEGDADGINHEAEWQSRIHPDDLAGVLAAGKKQGQGEKGFETLEYRERLPDGNYVWILSRGGPIEWDEQGGVVRSVGTDTDITHLKTVELELASEKERLRVTLESIADGVIATDAEGRIVFANDVALRLLGREDAGLVGALAAEIFVLRDADTDQVLACPGRTCIEQRRTVMAEENLVLLRADGERRDIRCTAAPVIMPDGAVTGSVLVFQDVSQSRALQRQLAHSASHDALTGLANRAAFETALNGVIASARGAGRPSCLVYADLDRFKPVNDSAGHAAGDALLRQVAQTIRDSCRTHDMVARIGGDEFALLLEGCSIADGRRVAEKIVRAIEALVFVWAGREYRIGISAGLTAIGAGPASPLGFMGEADAACYAAKAAGRGRVMTFDDMVAGNQP